MEFYIGLQKEAMVPGPKLFCRDQSGTAFMLRAGAMYLEGKLNLISYHGE